ncbi:energy transducer TonB [Flavobacterium flavipallidum]|uniref:Energy transducer TonB n=1 Tax=Flavobacterium flavipallidum TaxID=3139140 RepID=A0ABU9HME7_9FLAO
MSNHSLYESKWINLVFENRNKEYGAFQLRQETTKTTFKALSLGILLCSSLIVIPNLLHVFNGKEVSIPVDVDWSKTVIQLEDIYQAEQKPEAAAAAPPPAQSQTITDAVDTKQLINPIVTSATQATPVTTYTLDRTNPVENPSNGMTTAGSEGGVIGGVEGGTINGNGTAIGNTETNGTEIVNSGVLDRKPEFPGGIEKFYRYVGNHFVSPAMEDSRNVRITVSFVVEKDGSMTDIKVLNHPGAALEREAIRVLKSIKAKWSPGIYNSKAVRTAYNLPIVVQIE